MNILVQGAGALGAYFGGRLLEAGHNVAFFVREKRAVQLKKEGLKITSPEGNFESKDVTVYTSPEEVQNIDLIIVTVKGYHLDQAIPQLQTIVERTGSFVLPLLNGMDTAKELRQSDKAVQIIFLTSSSEFALEAFEVKARGYLLKPISYEKLKEQLDDCSHNFHAEPNYLVLKTEFGYQKLYYRDIEYIEAQNKLVLFYM